MLIRLGRLNTPIELVSFRVVSTYCKGTMGQLSITFGNSQVTVGLMIFVLSLFLNNPIFSMSVKLHVIAKIEVCYPMTPTTLL